MPRPAVIIDEIVGTHMAATPTRELRLHSRIKLTKPRIKIALSIGCVEVLIITDNHETRESFDEMHQTFNRGSTAGVKGACFSDCPAVWAATARRSE
jgi:hypothetical protein